MTLKNTLSGLAGHPRAFDGVLDRAGLIILGKDHEIRLAIACLLANGHLLIEDLPGMGKTTLAHTLARLLGRDADRVSRLFIQLDGAEGENADFASFVKAQHPDLELLRVDAGELKGLLGQAGDPDPVTEQPIYIVDQRGFVMMRYLARHSGHDTIADQFSDKMRV